MIRALKYVRACWPFVEFRPKALLAVLGGFFLVCVGLGHTKDAVTWFGFSLRYLQSTDPSLALRTGFQECFSLAWMAIWVTTGYASLQRLARFFSPGNQLWLRMRGVSIFAQTLTGIAWSIWLSLLAAVGSASALIYICWRQGFALSLAMEHSVGIFGALLFAHLFCVMFFCHGRVRSGTRQQIVFLSLALPMLFIILGAALFQEHFSDNFALLPAAAPYVYAVPGLDFKKLVLSTNLWATALLSLALASSAVRSRVGVSNIPELSTLNVKGDTK